MSRFKNQLLGTVAGAAALAMCTLGAPSAMAAIITVDNVDVPLGSTPGGFVFSTQTLYENVVTAVGQENIGAGQVNVIGPPSPPNTYNYGANGVFLNFIISGFQVARIVNPTASTAGEVDFTGGTINFYADAAALSVTGTVTSVNNAISSGGPLFLSLTAEPTTAAGYTIVATLPPGSSTNQFSAVGSTGFFAVSGGDLGPFISPTGFSNLFSTTPVGTSPAGFAAIIFTSTDSTVCGTNAFSTPQPPCPPPGQEFVNGSGQAKFNTELPVPEPTSLALLGSALLGWGCWMARRRRSRQSA